jgi:hypothetical protein
VKPAAVAIDTLNRSLVGSESSDQDMAAYVRAADAIGNAFDCVVPVIHHCGHNGERPRGHSSLLGAADIQISVKRDAADNIVATVEAAKDGPIGLEIVSRLVTVDVGQDEDGDAISSCVIEPVGEPATAAKHGPAAKPGRRSDDVEKIKRAIVDNYERLADSVAKTPGFDDKPVKKIKIDKLRRPARAAALRQGRSACKWMTPAAPAAPMQARCRMSNFSRNLGK